LSFLEQYKKDGDEFLSHIVQVTGDETWVSFMNIIAKEQSKQRMHKHSPSKPKKFKQMLSASRVITTMFWDRKGVLMVEFMQQGTTLTSELFCVRHTKRTV
jgi:hypothetical protein